MKNKDNVRHYTVELSDAAAERLQLVAEREETTARALAAELEGIPGGPSPAALSVAADARGAAEGWRAVRYMPGDEDPLTLATRSLSRWYRARVSELAVDVLQTILRGEVSDLNDHLHETVDSTDIVIYTHKAKCALLASDNEDAYQDQMGEPAPTVEAAAFMALETDVREELQRLADSGECEGTALPDGFDLYDESTWTGTPAEDAGDETADEDAENALAREVAEGNARFEAERDYAERNPGTGEAPKSEGGAA